MTIAQKSKIYYELAKPGIVYGNAITAAAGFFLASRGHLDFLLFIEMLAGISFVIASGAVLNNYIDRGIDAKMSRTKERALVKGLISVRAAIVYAAVLGILGFGLLIQFTNTLATLIAALGAIFYVLLYAFFKRRSIWGTQVGAVSGAVAPLVGYCAVTNKFDAGAILLFLFLFFWQIPHFFAIGIYRYEDYKNAGLPILPVTKSIRAAKAHILFYIIIFTGASALLTIYHYTGYIYLIAALALGAVWFCLGVRGFNALDEKTWARKMFLFSLIVLTAESVLMAINVL